jgi:uncharacterized membrane protein
MKTFISKYKWLQPALMFTLALLAGRMAYASRFTFLFIPWNLFLAIVPLYFSHRLSTATTPGRAAIYIALWLLFFPHAMYIVTDLFHLRQRIGIPMWYDLLILLSAAMTGVIMGFLSLREVERYLQRTIKAGYVPWVIFCAFLLCGYGIYLGRYLRWNSWDIVVQPVDLLSDIAYNIIHPLRNKECWTLTLLFGLWMHILYTYFKRLKGAL